jgi:hypothetical protein
VPGTQLLFASLTPDRDISTPLSSDEIVRLQCRQTRLPVLSSFWSSREASRAPARYRAVVKAINDHEPIDGLWVFPTSPAIISLLDLLSSAARYPVYTTVWDDPIYFCRNLHLLSSDIRRVRSEFGRLLRRSSAVMVMSEQMRDLYYKEFNVESTVIRNASTSPMVTGFTRPHDGPITIAFAGSLYAKVEWAAFLAALALCRGNLNNRPVRVRFWGPLPRLLPLGTLVHYEGYAPLDELRTHLGQCDFAYLPYWHSHRMRIPARTSFPSKLTTYLEAGLPILFHGPDESPAAQFIRRYGIGSVLTSTRVRDIANQLPRIQRELEILRATGGPIRLRVLREQFDLSAFRSAVCSALTPDSASRHS